MPADVNGFDAGERPARRWLSSRGQYANDSVVRIAVIYLHIDDPQEIYDLPRPEAGGRKARRQVSIEDGSERMADRKAVVN